MKIYVINKKNDTHRRRMMEINLGSFYDFDFEFVEAVEHNDPQISRRLSHIKALETVAKSEQKFVAILEDNCLLDGRSYDNLTGNFWQDLDFDLIRVDVGKEYINYFWREHVHVFENDKYWGSYCYNIENPGRSAGYIVKPKSALDIVSAIKSQATKNLELKMADFLFEAEQNRRLTGEGLKVFQWFYPFINEYQLEGGFDKAVSTVNVSKEKREHYRAMFKADPDKYISAD